MRLNELHANVARAVLDEAGRQSPVTTAAHKECSGAHFLARGRCRSAGQCQYGESLFPLSFLGRHEPVLRRGSCRNAVAAVRALRPGVLSRQDHTPSGLVFVVNPGEGAAAQHFVSRRLGLLRRNRPARQISPTCGLPREANFSGLPVLHCVAAPPLRYGMRRARTLTHRITPRPRWARPGQLQ